MGFGPTRWRGRYGKLDVRRLHAFTQGWRGHPAGKKDHDEFAVYKKAGQMNPGKASEHPFGSVSLPPRPPDGHAGMALLAGAPVQVSRKPPGILECIARTCAAIPV